MYYFFALGLVSRPCTSLQHPMDKVSAGDQRYTRGAIALHWSMTLRILFNLSLGFFMEGFKPQLCGVIVPLHVSSGLTVLILTMVRAARRLEDPPPFFASGIKPWERTSALSAHELLYLLMIFIPLTGWSIISAHQPRPGASPKLWGLVGVPPIPPIAHLQVAAQKAAHASFVEPHSIGAWILVALLFLHAGAALKHQFHDRQAELAPVGIGSFHG